MRAPKRLDASDDQRLRGMHIGAALRHARAAASLNLDNASIHAICREAALAVDALWLIVWSTEGGRNA